MTSTLILVGAGLAALGFIGKVASKNLPRAFQTLNASMKLGSSKYYKGGFQQTMSKSEASLILGISTTASKNKIKEAHRRIMLLNHPDKGGSPYIAAKINEAKDLMETQNH